MLDQVAGDGERPRTRIARREPPHIRESDIAAIKDVESLDAGFRLLGESAVDSCEPANKCHEHRTDWFHDLSPRILRHLSEFCARSSHHPPVWPAKLLILPDRIRHGGRYRAQS